MVLKLNESQIEEFREAFNSFDLDGGGSYVLRPACALARAQAHLIKAR